MALLSGRQTTRVAEGFLEITITWVMLLFLRHHMLNMELNLQSLFGLPVHSCTHWLYWKSPKKSPLYSSAETPQPPPPPHLGSYTRALSVSQDRRHLFVTPLCATLYCHKPQAKLPQQLFSSFLYAFLLYGCTRLYTQISKPFPGNLNDDFQLRRSTDPPDFVVMRALLVLSSTSSTMEKVKPVGFGSSLSVGGGGVT